ncbi:MAG: ribonuclease H-like domain-containing protein [Planctomycetes bacterium]|nr:ribonuclease H-like domain-containing protein [Planctomycetota bacterium]MCB9909177.1 ribonuclease H-like domain-containing protein [Planctomycetota bacterium]HRV81671.1 ribonuclease H-like domain-containing protein [Planctomycetota bacterium]
MKRRLTQTPAPVGPLGTSQVPKTAETPKDLLTAPSGRFQYRVQRFARTHRHGAMELQGNPQHLSEVFPLLTGDPTLADLHGERVVYLDTETTGLSGGAGVFVYMVGLARFVPDGVEVWQGFLSGPEQEAALLAEVSSRIAASAGVVSFFGKSFDRHRLEDKMRLHGITPPFAGKPHLDLFHPLRRLHRETLPDTRLQTMERALCGVVRPDDLPGSLAPEAWFDFLAGRAHRLEGVFQHNLDDVLSLITLLHWLAALPVRELSEIGPVEWAREAAWIDALAKAGQYDRAWARWTQVQEKHPAPPQAWLQKAQLEDRMGRAEDALDSLRHGFPEPRPEVLNIRALALAAKLRERSLRDGLGALADANLARKLLAEMRPFSGRTTLESDLIRRCQRLNHQLAGKASRPEGQAN